MTPVEDAGHFLARLGADDAARVRRDIERDVEARIHDALGDLYRRLGHAVERVGERLGDGDDGKPLVFRNTMIEHLRALVDVVPRLNLFGTRTWRGSARRSRSASRRWSPTCSGPPAASTREPASG